MDLDRGRFVDPHHSIIIEVALLHPAFGDHDLVVEGGREPEDEAALDLRHDAVGIDDRAAIDHRHHAADRDLSLAVDLGLHDRRDIRAEHALAGYPASNSCRKSASPTRLFRRKIEADEKPRVLREMRSPEGGWILTSGVRQLVDETLDDKNIVSRAHASPEAGRHAGRLDMEVPRVRPRPLRTASIRTLSMVPLIFPTNVNLSTGDGTGS
jgi:hypothetical protein